MKIAEEERDQLERAYQDAFSLDDRSGRHWILMSVLARLGHPVNSRQEAMRVAEELLYGISAEDERYLRLADEEE